MDEPIVQQPEVVVVSSEDGSDQQQEVQEPPQKRTNFLASSQDILLQDQTEEAGQILSQFYEQIDPAQPSTSRITVPNVYQASAKFSFNSQSASLNTNNQSGQKNRLRAQRNTTIAIAEAAQKNGMQTINRSGSRFVVPITMQAHPTPITDRILDEKDDILSQHEAFPYCCHCHSIVKTWRGLEYHVLREHLKYRAYRCSHCQKECFYTEEEGRFHLSTNHPNDQIVLMKEFDPAKEIAARNAFKHIFLMCRDGPEVTKQRVFDWELEAAQQVMKFQYLRFKRPVVLTKKPPSATKDAQTDLTSVHIMVQPVVNRSGRIYQNIPMDFHHVAPRVEYPVERLPGTLRPRSTATQHDEDPRDREKRVAALMHAVTSSHD